MSADHLQQESRQMSEFPMPLNAEALRASDEELKFLEELLDSKQSTKKASDAALSLFPYSNFGVKARAYHGLQLKDQEALEKALNGTLPPASYQQSGAFPSHVYWPDNGSLSVADTEIPIKYAAGGARNVHHAYPERPALTADIPEPERQDCDADVLEKYNELYEQIGKFAQLPVFPELWARKFVAHKKLVGEEEEPPLQQSSGEEEDEDVDVDANETRSIRPQSAAVAEPRVTRIERPSKPTRPQTAFGGFPSSSSSSSSSTTTGGTANHRAGKHAPPIALLPRHVSEKLAKGAQKLLRAHEKFARHFADDKKDSVLNKGPILHPEEDLFDYENWAYNVTTDPRKLRAALKQTRVQVRPFDGNGETYRVHGDEFAADLEQKLKYNDRAGKGATYVVARSNTKDSSSVGMGGYDTRFKPTKREPWQIALGPGSHNHHVDMTYDKKMTDFRRARAFMMDPKRDPTGVKADSYLQERVMHPKFMHVYEPTVGSYSPSYDFQTLDIPTPCLESGGEGHATQVADSGLQKWVDIINNNRVPGPGAFRIRSQLDDEVRAVQFNEQIEKYMKFPRAERKLIETPAEDRRKYVLKQQSSIDKSKLTMRWCSPNLELIVPERVKHLNGEIEGRNADLSKQSLFGPNKQLPMKFQKSRRFLPLRRVFDQKSDNELEREQRRRSQFVANITMANRNAKAAAKRVKLQQQKLEAESDKFHAKRTTRMASKKKPTPPVTARVKKETSSTTTTNQRRRRSNVTFNKKKTR